MKNQRNMTSIILCSHDKILLLFRHGSQVANDVWVGAAGGHFEENELNNAEACVLRELSEELSITENMLRDMKLRYITLRNKNGEIRVNYYFFACLENGMELSLKSNEGTLKWFDKSEINKLKKPFSFQFVMEHYLDKGQFDQIIYGGVANGSTMVFTVLPEF